MLQEIYETLKKRQGDSIVTMKATKDVGINVGINGEKLLLLLKQDGTLTAKILAGTLGITQRQVERMIAKLKREGSLIRHGANKNGFWEVVKKDM